MIPPPSTTYAAVDGLGIVREKGSVRNMRKRVRREGGRKKGWMVYNSPRSKIGDIIRRLKGEGQC
jgi:hypothetical protein